MCMYEQGGKRTQTSRPSPALTTFRLSLRTWISAAGGLQDDRSTLPPVGQPPSRSGLALFADLMDELVLSILNLPPKALELRRDALARCAYAAARCVAGERRCQLPGKTPGGSKRRGRPCRHGWLPAASAVSLARRLLEPAQVAAGPSPSASTPLPPPGTDCCLPPCPRPPCGPSARMQRRGGSRRERARVA